MKASRLPRPVTGARLLPAFSSSELARKRLRHLSGSSSGSTSAPSVPAKTQRAATPPPAHRPAKSSTPAALEGIASANPSLTQSVRPKCVAPLPVPSTSAAADEAMVTDNEGFTLVTKKNKKEKKTPTVADPPGAAAAATESSSAPPCVSAPPPGPPAPAAARSGRPSVGVARPPPRASEFPAFRVPSQEGFATSYDAVALLESNHAHLKLRNIAGRDGSSVLLPLDQESFSTLNALASDSEGAITIIKLDAGPQLTKGVVMGYPVRMPLTILQRHPQVEEATRCSTRHQETRQVLISVRGPLPPQIDLGNWGVFYTRPYSPEPLRCYRCQKFGHHQASCSRAPVCGVCSAAHPTQQCLDKLKAHQETQPRCPNCSKRHHAWNLRCPARLQRVNSGRERQAQWVLDHQLTATVPAPPGTFVWGQQKLKPRPPPAAEDNEEDFPPLPSSPPKSVSTQHTSPPPPPHHSPDTICITRDSLLAYANEITSAVAELLSKAAGVTIDLAAFQETMVRANAKIIEKLFTTTRP